MVQFADYVFRFNGFGYCLLCLFCYSFCWLLLCECMGCCIFLGSWVCSSSGYLGSRLVLCGLDNVVVE